MGGVAGGKENICYMYFCVFVPPKVGNGKIACGQMDGLGAGGRGQAWGVRNGMIFIFSTRPEKPPTSKEKNIYHNSRTTNAAL